MEVLTLSIVRILLVSLAGKKINDSSAKLYSKIMGELPPDGNLLSQVLQIVDEVVNNKYSDVPLIPGPHSSKNSGSSPIQTPSASLAVENVKASSSIVEKKAVLPLTVYLSRLNSSWRNGSKDAPPTLVEPGWMGAGFPKACRPENSIDSSGDRSATNAAEPRVLLKVVWVLSS